MNDPLGLFGEEQNNDPLGLFENEPKQKAGWGTAIKSSFANVGNMVDLVGTTIAGGGAALFGDDEEALRLADEMEARRQSRNQWANPDNLELTTGGKIAGAVATLPMQMLTMGLSPAETTRTALESGESNEQAIKAGLVDAAGNAVGIAIPGFKQGSALVRGGTGAAANVVQELGTKYGIQSMMETEQGKQTFAPNMDDALVSGIVGAGLGVTLGKTPSKNKRVTTILDENSKAMETKKPPVVDTPEGAPYKPNDGLDGQMNLFPPEVEGRGISPYEAVPGDWRIDENGMPIKADLSMDVQNMQNPLQRNLWGDELSTPEFGRDPNAPLNMDRNLMGYEKLSDPVINRTDPEAAIPLTEAIDSMDWAHKRGALKKTQMGRELPADGPMEAAKMQADIEAASGDNLRGFNARMRKQGGGLLIGNKKVTVDKVDDGFVARVGDTVVGHLRSNLTPEQRSQLGETANVDIVKVSDEYKGQGVGRALYDAWSKANDGNVAPSGKTSADAWKVWKRNYPEKVDSFVAQEASRIIDGSPSSQVLGNIPDPEVRSRVAARASLFKKQGGAIDPDVFLKDFPEFIKSKMVDSSGKLKRFYHGTSKDKTFSDIKAGPRGAFFTDDPASASSYAKENDSMATKYNPDSRRFDKLNNNPHVHEVYLNITNPYMMDATDLAGYSRAENYSKFQRNITEKAKALGHDGIDWGHGIVTIFDGAQSKSTLSPSTKPKKLPFNFKKQGGGIFTGDPLPITRAENALAMSEDGSYIPKNPDMAKVLEKAISEPDSKLWSYTQSGMTSAAMKSGSSAMKATAEVIQNALKRADLSIRHHVFPAEKSLRKLSRQQLVDVGEIMKTEMFSGKRLDGDVLAKHLSVKEVEAYTQMRKLFDESLNAQNDARIAKGQKPITAQEAYVSSRWSGDFRRPVYNAEGKLVWYLAADSKIGLEGQTKALLKEFPDLVIDKSKDHQVTSSRNKTDLQSMYSTMLDLLGRDDPAILTIRKALEEQVQVEGSSAFAQEKHFERKGNIRGFVGDRPGFDTGKEAIAMFQQQIQYAKNAFKWTEMQAAADGVKDLVSNPDLQKTQPNTVKLIREYTKNAMGMGESAVAREAQDALRRGLGISPSVVQSAVGSMKSFFIIQKLAASTGYTLANMVQSANVIPYLTNLSSQGYKGSNAKAVAIGYPTGMAMAFAHYARALGAGEFKAPVMDQFIVDAFKYAEDNGVTARSVYDEAPLETGFGLGNKALNIASKTMTGPETFVRSIAFMTYAQKLLDSGKFKDHSKLFQKAEELTNMSMVDYRETERPLMYSKAGAAGNFLNTLQTFPMSFYNQFLYMGGEAMKGRPAGLAAMLGFQYLVAGAMGIPGFDDADKLYKWIKDDLVSTSTWAEMQKSPFLSDPKLWMMETLGSGSLYGALSDKTGIGITSRVAAPGAGAMLQSPVGPAIDIGKQAANWGSALIDPTNSTKWAQAAMSSVPVGLAGLLEQSEFMKDHTYTVKPDGSKVFMKNSDLAARKGQYERTPFDESVRQWGIRSQKEVEERALAYSMQSANMALDRRSGELVGKIYDAYRRGDEKSAAKLSELYTELTGKTISKTQFETQLKEELFTDIQKNSMRATTPQKLLNTGRVLKQLGTP